jgi:hypothetical protein
MQYRVNENFEKHVSNMDYTAIQNAKAEALDEDNWVAFEAACIAEAQWLEQQS